MTVTETSMSQPSPASNLEPKGKPLVEQGHRHLFIGHLHNLTPEQEAALATFKENLTTAGLYKVPSSEEEVLAHTHHDATLLRYLRARSWDVAAAQKQFADSEEWRRTHKVDVLFSNYSADDLEYSKRFYPRWTGRRDKNGVPLYVFKLASVEAIQSELFAIPEKTRYQRVIVLNEIMCRYVFPLCSQLPRPIEPIPISSTTTIIDLEGVSFTGMWKLRHHLQEPSKLSTANYPETLHMIVIVNAPSFFPTIWNWVKGWFDEGTRRKIHILGRDPGSTLRELIDAEHIPKAYGGEFEWSFLDDPCFDQHAKQLAGEPTKGAVTFVNGKTIVAGSK